MSSTHSMDQTALSIRKKNTKIVADHLTYINFSIVFKSVTLHLDFVNVLIREKKRIFDHFVHHYLCMNTFSKLVSFDKMKLIAKKIIQRSINISVLQNLSYDYHTLQKKTLIHRKFSIDLMV